MLLLLGEGGGDFLQPLHLFFFQFGIYPPRVFLFGHVLSCSAWPVLRSGLAALCLVSRRSVWYRGALFGTAALCLVYRRSFAWPESVSLRVCTR